MRDDLFRGGAWGLVENVNAAGAGTMAVEGNVFADYFNTAVYLGGGDPSYVYLLHNTFARNNRAQSAFGGSVYRGNTARKLFLVDNAHLRGTGAALTANGGLVPGVDAVDYDAMDQLGPYCSGCAGNPPNLYTGPLGLASTAGSDFATLAPLPSSKLVDSGLDLIDRNGEAIGRYYGAGPDRGAVELLK